MIGYSSNPEDELKYLEKYRKLLTLEIERIKNEIKYLEQKIEILKEMQTNVSWRNIPLRREYAQPTQPPPPPQPPYPYGLERGVGYGRYGKTIPYPTGGGPIEAGGRMIIAIASQDDKGLESIVSPVFARAPFFTLIEVENGEIKRSEVIPNQFSYYGGGAGMSVAQWLIQMGVNIVVAGNFGPNSIGILQQTGIRTLSYPNIPVKEALKNLINP